MIHLLWLPINKSLVSIGYDPGKCSLVITTGKNAWTRKYFYYDSIEALSHVLRKHISNEDLRAELEPQLVGKKLGK